MGVVTGNIPADDLRDLIQSAQSDLARAADADVLRGDSYRLILAGLSGILAVFGPQHQPMGTRGAGRDRCPRSAA